MNAEYLLNKLQKSDANFHQKNSSKDDLTKYHIHYLIPKIVSVPRKPKLVESTNKIVVFGHIYIDNDKNVYWMRFAKNSSAIIGHNCILEIFNLLDEQPIKIKNNNGTEIYGIKITDSNLENVIIPNLLLTISKPIYLKDVDMKL